MFALLIGYVVFALFFGKPAKTKQVVQPTRVVKQVVYLRFLLILSVAIVANTFSTSAFCSAGVRGFGAR
jgi:hypothetical protein